MHSTCDQGIKDVLVQLEHPRADRRPPPREAGMWDRCGLPLSTALWQLLPPTTTPPHLHPAPLRRHTGLPRSVCVQQRPRWTRTSPSSRKRRTPPLIRLAAICAFESRRSILSCHAALNSQRDKVKATFMAAQRDMQQEREQKFAMIKNCMQVSRLGSDTPPPPPPTHVGPTSHARLQLAATLGDECGLREIELADAEESRQRRNYATARQRRSELEMAETRFGFLSNQVRPPVSRAQSIRVAESRCSDAHRHRDGTRSSSGCRASLEWTPSLSRANRTLLTRSRAASRRRSERLPPSCASFTSKRCVAGRSAMPALGLVLRQAR